MESEVSYGVAKRLLEDYKQHADLNAKKEQAVPSSLAVVHQQAQQASREQQIQMIAQAQQAQAMLLRYQQFMAAAAAPHASAPQQGPVMSLSTQLYRNMK